MKAFVAALMLAAAAPLAQAATEGVSPISKVLELITDLQAKVIKEGEEAQKIYAEYAEWCEDRSKDLGFEIKTVKAQVADLKAVIEEETATSAALETKIEELSSAIASNEGELKEATELRAKESKDFAAEEKELVEVIDMLERASGILEREMAKGGAAMLQMKNVGNLAQAFDVMVKASLIGSADASKLSSFVQSSSSSSDSSEEADTAELTGAPAAAAYQGQSGGILDTMADLTEKAQAQLDEIRTKETAALHNYEMLKQSLTDEVKFATKDMDEAKKGLAESAEKKSAAEGDLAVSTKDMGADVEAKSELHHVCMTKAEDFEQETTSRGEELKALAEAKKTLTEMTSGAAEQAYSFVQVASKAKSRSKLANFEVVRFVRDLGRKQHAPALAQLATHIANVMHNGSRGGLDPFAKVKAMITDMVGKLEDEAEADATKKAYCDKEMGETEDKKSDKEDEVETLSTKIEQMKSQSAKLKEEVVVLQKELAKLTSAQAEMDKIRKEEKAAYDTSKPQMEMGLEGVKKALSVLKEYYGKEDAGSSGAGASIIGLLEVVESDFSKELAELISTEESAVAAYEEETKENEVEVATKTADVKHKTKTSASLDKASGDTKGDLASVQTELDAVMEYYSRIKAECIAKPEPYEERKKRREAEIAGLKEALTILENEAALIQQKTTHRSLRGVKLHSHAA